MKLSLSQARHLLESGGIVAVPTETVYGLAASIECPQAIEAIFSCKGRPAQNPLIIHVASPDQLVPYVLSFPEKLDLLLSIFWPGPLTVVLPIDVTAVPERVRSGRPTAAFRMPQHPLALQLLNQVGPLVMPSANLSGRPSATSADHVESDFGIDFPVLDGGPSVCGVESTILYADGDKWHVVRQGALAPEVFEPILGYVPGIVTVKKDEAPLCPGQLFRHYAPEGRLLLSNTPEQYSGVVIGFSENRYPLAEKVLCLGSVSNPEQVAANLYAVLRQIDQEGILEAAVDMNFSRSGLWQTIAERLHRAASSH